MEQKEEKYIKKGKQHVKVLFKITLYIALFVVLLNLILYGLLSIPSIQKTVLDFTINKIKEKVHTEIRINEIRLGLFNHVSMKGIYIEDLAKDTLLYAEELNINLKLQNLLKNELLIKDIDLNGFTTHISQQALDSAFNFQFFVDAFSSSDTTKIDTTHSNIKIDIQSIKIKRGQLKYDVLSEPQTPDIFNIAHIALTDINSEIELPSLELNNLDVNLNHLSFKDQSGLELIDFKVKLNSKNSTFYAKNIVLKLPQSTLNVPNINYNILTKSFDLRSFESQINPSDLCYLFPNLKYLQNNIGLKLDIKGQLPQMTINSLDIDYGQETKLNAAGFISDYENYDNANINLDINHFQIDQNSLTDFAKLGDSLFVSPDILQSLGTIFMQGKIHGKFENLNANTEIWAKQGTIQMIAKTKLDKNFENYLANVRIQTQNFNLGNLLDISEIGNLSADLISDISQTIQQPLTINATGNIENIQYNQENYKGIAFTAHYDPLKMGGSIKADMPQGKIDGKVDMIHESKEKLDIDLNIQQLKIDPFYKNPNWKQPSLSMHVFGNIKGLDLKNTQADMSIKDFEFSHDTLSYKPGSFSLKAGISDSTKNYIRFASSLLTANIQGDYDLIELSDNLSDMMNHYLPGLFKRKISKLVTKNNFDFNLSINNTEELGKILDLPINIIQPLTLKGSIDTKNNLFRAIANLPLIRYDDIGIRNSFFELSNTDSIINITGKSYVILEAGDIDMDLKAVIKSDTIYTSFTGQRNSENLKINIPVNFKTNLKLNNKDELISYIKFKADSWMIGDLKMLFTPAEIKNDPSKTTISNLGLNGVMNRYIGLNGVISDQKTDTLSVSFVHSEIGDILKVANINYLKADLNGDIKIASILDKPEMYTKNLNATNVIIFNDTLGNLKVRSRWGEDEGAIKFEALLGRTNMDESMVRGLIYPAQDSLKLRINLEKFPIAWTQPFVEDMLNKVSGNISSKLMATGKLSAPEINGWLGINDTYIGVNYTNVTYHIADTINVSSNKIGFDNLVVEDPKKNKALVNAIITHKGFENIQYKIDAKLTEFMVLNTASRTDSLFYGTVFATGNVDIKGSDDLVKINMNVRNGKNSVLNVQIPPSTNASVYESIVYINTPKIENKNTTSNEEQESDLPLKLAINLNVTPDILLNVVIDPITGDALQTKGSGLIKFNYDLQADAMNAFGDYTLSDGSVRIKLQNLANMSFKIREGSKLNFNGDPLKTSFNINAYKRVKADLTTLDQSFGLDPSNSPKVFAECILGITGDIKKMNLTYDVDIPEARDDVQQRFKTIVSTNEQKVRQFANLLVTGLFYNSQNNITDGLLTNIASSALSSGLNAVLGSVIGNDWQIGTNITSSDGSFSDMDMSVNLSRKFLDNRLEFNTNLGYRTDQTSNNSFIGDFDVAYSLTRNIKLKVFNKTNDKYYKQAPTTQGIGVVYTKEAKTLKGLFKVFRKKRHKQNERNNKNR